MAEFEKFKRRVIRSVARKTLEEKKTEEEVWNELKAETKCDCMQFWQRMRGLTLKKLRRLLLADDKFESIIPIAQMSLTDWLLFDLVLVHEDVDVIGRDILDPKTDLGPLQELVDLINEFNIERKQGEALVAAWTLVTYNYNNGGRQCSPMLLQRRWYQLKQLIRRHFYGFWYKYRGNIKILDKLKDHIPSKFEMTVAKRYPYIVTKPFIEWETLIEKKLVILPQEFENKFRSQCAPKSASKTDSEPDVVLLERNIETIELADVDSDTEHDGKDCEKSSTDAKIDPKSVVVKAEPKDDVEPHKPTNAEKFSKELSQCDAQWLENSNIEDDDIMDVDEPTNEDTVMNPTENLSEINHITTTEDVNVNTSNEITNNIENVEPMMPQITSVFGNITVETEMLAKISNAFNSGGEKTALNEPDNTNAADPRDVNDIAVDEKLKFYVDNEIKPKDTCKLNNELTEKENCPKSILPSDVENARVTNPFLGVPIDLTFTDDGVELVDDGIEYDEDEEDIIKTCFEEGADVKGNFSSTIDTKVIKEEVDDASDNKFDLKLLMLPIVYTTRIDHMNALKNVDVGNINDKQIIEKVLIESKPLMKQDPVVEIKKENIENNESSLTPGDDKFESNMDSSSEPDETPEIKRVKLSSYLLQKPRRRSYNPIQLCKNPDFNTRLKRLTVGFLSSTRNRAMLKTLKPMTVDISKAFENKLLNGTLYLKPTDTTTPVPQVAEENQQMTTVLPSAMSVQSLIDQTPPQQLIVENLKEKNMQESQSKTDDEHVIERNKKISLPDIDKIRKMNQRLYTVEVTPMRVQGSIQRCTPPVKIVKQEEDATTAKAPMTSDKNNPLMSDLQDKRLSKKLKTQRPLANELSTCSWLVKTVNAPNEYIYGDALITIDTLNKILNIISSNNGMSFEVMHRLTKSEKRALQKDHVALQRREKMIDKVLNNQHIEQDKTVKSLVSKRYKSDTYCCWAREKLAIPKVKRRHCCPRICECCCREEFARKFRVVSRKPKYITISDDEETKKPKRYIKRNSDLQDEIVSVKPKISVKWKEPEGIVNKSNVVENNVIAIEDSELDSTLSCQTPEVQQNINAIGTPSTSISIEWKGPDNIITKINSVENNVIAVDNTEQDSTTGNQTSEAQPTVKIVPNNLPRLNILSPAALGAPSNKRTSRNRDLLNATGLGNSYSYKPKELRKGVKVMKPPLESHPFTFSTQQTGQTLNKILYLNSKHSDIGQGAPIYLGRNKVLLTDGLIKPRMGTAKTNLNAQSKLPVSLPDFALPDGVRVVILPNGKVSFVVDENVNLDPESISRLPIILQAVREYLMKTKPSCNVSPNKNVLEVIDLIEDETSNNNDKVGTDFTNEVIPADNINTHSTENNETISSDTVPVDKESGILANDEVNVSVKESLKQTLQTQSVVIETNIDKENKNSKEVPVNSSIEKSSKQTLQTPSEVIESNLGTEGQNAKEVENTSEIIDGSNTLINAPIAQSSLSNLEPKNSGTAEGMSEGDQVFKDKGEANLQESHTNSNMNRKTLLSDLMEMSGISMEDVIPIAQENSVQEALPNAKVPPTTNQVSPMSAPTITEAADNNLRRNSVPVIESKTLAQLSAVYTYSQLKYACENNSKFFTLDLETGVVSIINVYIKHKSKIIENNDKAVIDLTDDQDGPVENVNLSNPRSLLKANTNSIIVRAQPLKAFKSVGILNRKKGKRVEMNATEAAMKEKRFKKQLLGVKDADTSDSSDDEPLSSLSKRIRMEESLGEVTTPSKTDAGITDNLDKSVQNETSKQPTEDLYSDNKEDAEMEHEISFLYTDDSDNEDCILGV